MNKKTLNKVGKWAQSRVASGEEPPWTYYKLLQFAEIAMELAAGFDSVESVKDTNIKSSKSAKTDIDTIEFDGTNIVKLDQFRPETKSSDVVVLPT